MYKAIILSLSVCLLSSCGSSDGSNDVDTSNDATQPSETDNIPTRESRLVFSINLTNENADQLHSIRPDGSDLQLLDPQAPGVEPDFSHSGNDIAFSISDIRIMPATGGEHTVLTFPDIQGGTYDTYPVWSPDDTEIAFVRYSPLNAPALYKVNVDTKVISLIGAAGGKPGWEVFGLDWSSDDNELAWGIWDPLGVGTFSAIKLFKGPADGSRAGVYLVDGSTPEWRPDGGALSWVSSIGLIIIGNDTAVGGTDIARGREPAWSPDGRLLAFQTEDQASLVIYDSADGSLTPVLDTLGRNIRGMSWQTIPVN